MVEKLSPKKHQQKQIQMNTPRRKPCVFICLPFFVEPFAGI